MDNTTASHGVTDHGDVLARMLDNVPLEGFERSFKMSKGSLLGERYLLGIRKSDIAPEVLSDICERIGMPPGQHAALRENLPRASTVHFGFERDDVSGTYKVYLEFAVTCDGPARKPGDTVLLHLAYKWDVGDPRVATVARYLYHPELSARQLKLRQAALCPDAAGGTALDATQRIIDMALRRTNAPLMYLEVSEEDNPRRSYDINLHDAGLRIEDIEVPLAQLQQLYAIPGAEFDPLFNQIRGRRLGHLSGGVNRHGRDFVTLYYDAEPP